MTVLLLVLNYRARCPSLALNGAAGPAHPDRGSNRILPKIARHGQEVCNLIRSAPGDPQNVSSYEEVTMYPRDCRTSASFGMTPPNTK